jgi:hypothetical protein
MVELLVWGVSTHVMIIIFSLTGSTVHLEYT